MTIGETIRKALKELSDGILDMISPKDFRLTDDKPKRAKGYTEEHVERTLQSALKSCSSFELTNKIYKFNDLEVKLLEVKTISRIFQKLLAIESMSKLLV